MKRCSQCNVQVDDVAKFCPQCGGNQFYSEAPAPDTMAAPSGKKSKKHIIESVIGALATIGVIAAIIIVNFFSGSFKKDDAKWYVKQTISGLTSGTVDNRYISFTKTTKEKVKDAFDELLDVYTDTFCEAFVLDGKIDEDGRKIVRKNIKKLLSETDYKITGVEKNNGFDVTVKIKTFSTYSDLAYSVLQENLTVYDDSYADFVLNKFTELVDSPSYGEEKTYVIHVFLKDNLWQLDEDVLITAMRDAQYDNYFQE